ncbi:MAG: hypothetical protein RMN25_08140 [Anaerolineae bacterium]|nr:hypothetical protein [Thermoflexales bacterium]MDW8407742.1 hypothetical protein [Anaerolineae bacterium]
MNTTASTVARLMERWGYLLLPDAHPYAPGQHRLLIAMREVPTEMHFDPESIRLRMGESGDSLNWSTIRLKYPLYGQRQVGLGRISISDRVDKRIEFFTYGGTIEAIHEHDQIVYALRSSAPILSIDPEMQDFSADLTFETEVMIARAQAQWNGNQAGFAHRLSQIEASQCYLATLRAILDHYQHNQRLRDGFRLFYTALCKEIELLAALGYWSSNTSKLNELLAPEQMASV